MSAPAQFSQTVAMAMHIGQEHYGDIGVSPDVFAGYVWNITLKHLHQLEGSGELLAIEFAKKLYLCDLYLTCGCVSDCEKAWKTLDSRFRKFVTDLVRHCYRPGTDIEEIADAVLVSLYLPDRSGRQRIASYDGRSSLATWLRVIVINRAINQRTSQRILSQEDITEVPDSRALVSLESVLRARRYQKALTDSLTAALQQLTTRDRLMLLWRYEENMPLGEMAKLLGIHQSNVTRQLIRLQTRLREAVIRSLVARHKLSSSAIAECLADTIDNPQLSLSLIDLIKRIPQEMPKKRASG